METATQSPHTPTRKRVISLGRVFVLGLACLPLLLFALLFARFATSQRVLAGVTLAGVHLGGLPVQEAQRRLAERGRAIAKAPLRFTLGAKRATASAEELGISLLSPESAARAMNVARGEGLWRNALRYLRSFVAEEDLPATLRVERPRFDLALQRLERALIDDPPFAGGIAVEGAVPRAEPPRPGRTLAPDAALRACSDAIARGQTTSPVPLSARTVTPALGQGSLARALALAARALARPVTLEAGERRLQLEPAELGSVLRSQVRGQELELRVEPELIEGWLSVQRPRLEAGPRDASFEVSAHNEVRVLPGEAGVRLATAEVAGALWSAAQTAEHRGELPLLRKPPPARSTQQAERLGIRKLVSSFTTRHPCCQPRVENIHRIATLLDGLVVEPGQTVSINAIVGPRTQKNGFVLAPSIEDGEMVDTVGGGVSQFATTFFNALLHAGYDIIERQPHSYWFPRYPMGHEATLSYPHPDIVFKNDSDAGILVKTSFTSTTITVKLYGDTGGRKVSSSVSERREIVRPAVELLPNRDLPADEEKVKEGGMIGWSVIASRTVTFADGTKKEEKRKVTYKPKVRRVEVHPCRIPKGEPGATGEPCPVPEESEEAGVAEAGPVQGQ